MTRQEREAAAIAATNEIFKGIQFDAMMAQFGLLADVAFTATNFVYGKHRQDANIELLYAELASAVAELAIAERNAKGVDKCAH